MTKQYDTLDGLKRAAIKHKRVTGCSHSDALKIVAREAGFADYHSACQVLSEKSKAYSADITLPTNEMRRRQGNVEIIEMSPELAAALKHQRDLDIAESGPQAPEPEIDHCGVVVSSRYGLEQELDTMCRILDDLPEGARDCIEMIWCDSKACACYTVTVRHGRWVDLLPDVIRDSILMVGHGFNSLVVEDNSNHVCFDPEWEGDDYDYTLSNDRPVDHFRRERTITIPPPTKNPPE